jgi:hypothetical protein
MMWPPSLGERRLEKYLGGNCDAMSLVAVPSVEEEHKRSLVRYREQLIRHLRHNAGVADGLMQGIEAAPTRQCKVTL